MRKPDFEYFFFALLCLLIFWPIILLWPLSLFFDQRRYKFPKREEGELLGLWRIFCFMHYRLREDGRCMNCGIKKQELVSPNLPELEDNDTTISSVA